MARTRTIDFLPEIFQTSTNRQFLSATLDQLVQEPKFKRIQGYVGRRVGPGVNADDNYVAESTPSRADYQLEPGVIFKNPNDTSRIEDAITYPGITDALSLQGAITDQADRLYTSEYYTWDPFIDFDKFINYSQYYWLPGGPDSVDVFSGGVPLTDNFTVTRENGVYTFSGISGTNPALTLVRGGSYTFDVAQNNKETVNFRVSTRGTSAWVIDYQTNPTLTLIRGNTYIFNLVSQEQLPFYIKTQPTTGINNLYNSGVVGNGSTAGNIIFTVPEDAPDTLYYANSTQMNMQGALNIVNATPGSGPGFWIQTDPGVNGRIPSTPNISSRDVLGVINNGEDLGTVTFNVPLSSAQNFYYDLEPISYNSGRVDLITALQLDQLNNVFVDQFLSVYPNGIDGVTDLNGRTVVFTNTITDPESGGWQLTSQYDPLPRNDLFNGDPGSFDTTPYDQTTYISDVNVQRSVWQIQYVTAPGGGQYMQLSSVGNINELQKFSIQFGNQYSNTGWFKNSQGEFEQIPLLTALRSVLYYQDGTDPDIFGRIKLVDQDSADTLDIDEIIGQKNYTSPNGVVFTNGLKVQFIGSVSPASYQNKEYYVEGVGTAIKLLPVTDFVTPETYTQSETVPYDSTPYDVGNYDASLNQPQVPDYLTINRASTDLNAWTRSNRWFHIDVITATAEYNNTVAVIDNNFRARRPILEYRAGTKLYNFGTQGKIPVDIVDFSVTDALSQINGSTGYTIDGYSLISGSRVIFAADRDPQVRNKIYVVEFIVPDSIPPLIAEPIINLTPATDGAVLVNQTIVSLSGSTQQGKSFWFDGVDWISSQQKTSVNQAPFFDVYDADGVSFGNRTKYPATDFAGSKLFSYAQVSGSNDPVLGFPVKYLSLTNIGDIVFSNNLYTDSFVYTKETASTTVSVSSGYVRQYSNRVDFSKEIGWQPAAVPSRQKQQFRFNYTGDPLLLDVAVLPNQTVPSVQLFVGSQFVEPSQYLINIGASSTTITLLKEYPTNSVIEVEVLSDQVSQVAFYEVPVNLENNPLNINSPEFTLGTTRQHYETICENLLNIQGPINGANNTRDLGNIIPYGTNILQQSSPLTLAGYFMRNQEYNIFTSLAYSSREYEQYKVQLLDAVIRNDYTNYNIPDMLTAVVTSLVAGRTQLSPFYWTDMLPSNNTYTQSTTVYTIISTPVFQLSTTYNFNSSNYQSVLVYVNDRLLTFGYDYEVSDDSPQLTITVPLSVGDVIVIREYATTYGTFVPATPTKLGLYPAFKPQIYLDDTYVNPTLIILGHDGSKTVAFGDFRDELLLEFETRIYNNLKIKSPIPLSVEDVVPGQFRTTDYSLSEINQILASDFLSWIGWNKLSYQTQEYIASNEFTWNYSATSNRLSSDNTRTQSPMPVGAWRGIYQYFYDTITPNTTPWEMLGFSQEPSWWQDVYGPAPYTSGNLVLWDDLALGRVADPAGEYFLPQFRRPELQQIIPADSEGNLLSPFDTVVGNYDSSQLQKSWVFGDQGPVEYSWRSSSSYPFAVLRLLALTRPAEFFSLFADRDLYKFNNEYQQYLYKDRYRLDANGVEVYGNGVSKASYINFIVDYNQQLGRDSSTDLKEELANLDVRLCYRMGSFTDKQYLQIYTERSSPNSINSSLLLPNESYNLLLYKNQPFDRVIYSSVILQVVEGGYAVFGYGITNPYFNVLVSKVGGARTTLSAGGTTVTVPDTYSNDIAQVPYGYVFTNPTVVCDFLLSYGALLERQGIVFNESENGYILNWRQMAQEFLYWANQGWGVGSIINLNPANTSLTVTRPLSIVDSIVAQTPENLILDQNRTTIPVRDLVVDRYENTFKVNSLSSQTISYLDIRFTNYETMAVLDNVSIFADLIYNPATGARQNRLNVSATVSAEWNGQLDAQGFILNDTRLVESWQPFKKYAKGEIVLFKNNYWSAQTIVQPSAEFRYSDWVKSDYTKIQRGLLQNIPNKADQLANSYNTYGANLNQDNDLLSYGLIGFRPREYMTSLNLDDISQVNLYQQFIHDKGTLQSVKLLTNANLRKEIADYDIFENWAIQRGVYGANANRSFIELRLNEALLPSDPATIQVVEPEQTSIADQKILLSDIWRQSYKLTSTNILPTYYPEITDSALPSAGYVNFEDVDITVFSLDAELELAEGVLNTIGIGTTVWAAKSNAYDWNIYRSTAVSGRVISVVSNLNGTSTVTFSTTPGLSVNDIVVIRYFDASVDGVYRVLSTPSVNSIVVALNTPAVTTGQGLAFVLETQRVAQASDVANLPYANNLLPGARAWVDNNGNGHWQVLEKQQPFTSRDSLSSDTPVANSRFGASVAQAYNNQFALIGAPDYLIEVAPLYNNSTSYVVGNYVTYNGEVYQCIVNSTGNVPTDTNYWIIGEPGALYPFTRSDVGIYTEVPVVTLNAKATSGYSNSVEIGNQNWAVVGASRSNNNQGYATIIYRLPVSVSFDQTQLLTDPDLGTGEFGHDVAISKDERWVYVSAPGSDKVYAYGRVDVPDQSVTYITDGSTTVYNVNGQIEFDEEEQIIVTLDGETLVYSVDYSVAGTVISLDITPAPSQQLIIRRKTTQNFVGDGSTDKFDLTNYLYTATTLSSITVLVNGVYQRPDIDYTFDDNTQEIEFTSPPATNADIVVRAGTYFQYINSIAYPGSEISPRFGSSVSTTTDGRQVIIGAKDDLADASHPRAGSVYVFDRSVTKYLINNTSVLTYAMPAGFQNPVAVLLNGEYLTNTEQYINGDFSIVGTDIVLSSSLNLNVGDVLEIESNIFNVIQKITANTLFDEADFGSAVDVCPTNCSIYIGAPLDGTIAESAGSVQRNVNQARVYGTITAGAQNPSLTPGDTIRINNFEVAVPSSPNDTVAGLANAINTYNSNGVLNGIPNVHATVNNGYLTISVVNADAALSNQRLNILPGVTGTAFADLDFEIYAYTQTIASPNPSVNANFGSALFIDTEADNLVVGAPGGNLYQPTTFDNGSTYFDDRSTQFSNIITQSGAVFTFDYLPSATDSVDNPGKFVFGQQIYDNEVSFLDQWGTAVSYVTGRLLIGSPGYESANYGRVGELNNDELKPAWTVIRSQQPVVNVYQLNSVFMYDKLQSSETHFLDFIDPLQGKILGAARQNIDYIGALDPAKYNQGPVNNNGNFWGRDHVGQIWWDITSVRFIDPNQDDIVYASRRWSQVFPGSSVDIYQWIQSPVPPSAYTGPGTPLNATSWTVKTELNNQGTFSTFYYFWVTGIDTIDTTAGKTLSTSGIARYIESPKSSGIPYLAALNSSTVAIYNSLPFISAADTILHVEYDRELNNDNIHTEYELIAAGKEDSFISGNLYRKLLDSFCGANLVGSTVPDPFLSPAERYGVQFRPRQSMFADRFSALKNYLTRANSILKNYPIVETRQLTLLNSSEPEPTLSSGEWNKRLINIEELGYQDIYQVPVGYRYLIVSDSTNNGLWTIYEVVAGVLPGLRETRLVRVQNYDTRKYWYHIDWYLPGYNPNTLTVAEVSNYAGLATLNVPVGSSVKITANAQGKWEIYVLTDTGWDRVGLQDGSLQFRAELWDYTLGGFGFDVEVFDAQYFDQEPVIETRKIIEAINQELFINELAIERNRLLILIFEIILSQFEAPEWLTKTSLIDVVHNIRELVPFQVYRRDNQEFVLDYLQEVKPYHVQVKSFNLAYNGLDAYPGSVTDFDIPSYFNTSLEIPQYVNPILLPYDKSTAVGTGRPSDIADTPADAEIWNQTPWNQWYNNYLLELQDVIIVNGGSGYTVAPQVIVSGTAQRLPTLIAVINSAGQVVGVDIVDPGYGFTTTCSITLVGGNGTGAVAYAVMGNDLVRSIKTTIKYDRYEYSSNIVDWNYTTTSYNQGSQVRYLDQVWQANNTVTNTPLDVLAVGTPDTTLLTVDDTTGLQIGQLAEAFGLSPDSVITDIVGNVVTLNQVLLSSINGTVTFYNTFNPDQWTRVAASTLSGIDRTQGYYLPGPNMPGRSLPLIIDGIDYPGVQVMAPTFNQDTGFDIGNYDINPFDNIAFGPEGRPTYDPGILDAIYESYYPRPPEFPLPVPTGTGYTDINVDGGAYIDTYSSHAPEELIPGSEFDTLDLRVYTRPGSDWELDGHGFPEGLIKFTYTSAEPTVSFADILPYPIMVQVSNQSWGLAMTLDIDYTVDYNSQTVTVIDNANDGDVIVVTVYELGGGSQLYKQIYNGADVGNTLTVPVSINEIEEFAIFVNGEYLATSNYTYTTAGAGQTRVNFLSTFTSADYVSLVVFGPTTVGSTTIDYSWSAPVTQTFVSDGSTTYTLSNSLVYTNPVNLVVTVNGIRARTAAGIEHYGDGSTEYLLPQRLGFSQAIIADNEVLVYINDVPQILGVDFTVEPYAVDDLRAVIFAQEPSLGARILIAVTTNTQCYINSGQLVFRPNSGLNPVVGDVIDVTTWNDTRQQNILTQVIVGPVVTGVTISEGYDDTDFDSGTVNNAPGSFDYTIGTTITVNDLQLGRIVTNPDRIIVTLNGRRQWYGVDFIINGEELILHSGVLGPLDVVMITQFAESVVPEAMAFRIFQDMRGVQAVYRITPSTTTELVQRLTIKDDIIYVADASALNEPNFDANIWGVLTIGGERIMYRERDLSANTVSGLLRGTAGTGIAEHSVGSVVYNMSRGNLLPEQFQNYVVSNSFLADGSTTTFTANDINLAIDDSTVRDAGLEVYVGGTLQSQNFVGDGSTVLFVLENTIVSTPVVMLNQVVQTVNIDYTITSSIANGTVLEFTVAPSSADIIDVCNYEITGDNPAEVTFVTAPANGLEVTVLVRRGVTWYAPGAGTPSDGVALQDTNTQAARFLRGL